MARLKATEPWRHVPRHLSVQIGTRIQNLRRRNLGPEREECVGMSEARGSLKLEKLSG